MATGLRTDYEYKNILCIIIYIICDVILCVRRLRIMIWAQIYIVIWHSEDSQLVKICIELLNNCWICGPHWMVCGACVCVIKCRQSSAFRNHQGILLFNRKEIMFCQHFWLTHSHKQCVLWCFRRHFANPFVILRHLQSKMVGPNQQPRQRILPRFMDFIKTANAYQMVCS